MTKARRDRSNRRHRVLTQEGLDGQRLCSSNVRQSVCDTSSQLPKAQPAKRSKQVSGTGEADIFVFRASLKPKVYRDLEISRSKTLYELAAAIVEAFDFDFDHCFGFYSDLGDNPFQSEIQYELLPISGRVRAWRGANTHRHFIAVVAMSGEEVVAACRIRVGQIRTGSARDLHLRSSCRAGPSPQRRRHWNNPRIDEHCYNRDVYVMFVRS